MVKALITGLFAGALLLGAPVLAHAGNDNGQGNGGNNNGNQNGQGNNSQGNNAPEPLTMLGLMLGAGGVAAARWKANRKSTAR
jgi:hypothetical protein